MREPQTVPNNQISITRGVRVDVLLNGLETIPAGLSPFVRVADCVRPPNLSCQYWINANGNFWSIGITHQALLLAGVNEIPPPDWPDMETCEAARAPLQNWIGGLAATTGLPAFGPTIVNSIPVGMEALRAFLTRIGVSTAVAANPTSVGTAVAAGTVALVFYTMGIELGQFFRGEVDCSAVLRRSGILKGFQAGLSTQSFNTEVCFPAVVGIAY